MNIIKSLATVSFFTLISKASGFIRSMLMTSILGATMVSDALIIALKIANVLRKVFAEGAFNSAFVPIFSRIKNINGIKKANSLANRTFSFLLYVTVIISVIVINFYDKVILIFAPGFKDARLYEAIYLGKILFPFIISACLVALMSSILNTLGKFALPSSIQVLVNLFSIAALIASEHYDYEPAYLVAIGIVTAGCVQVLILWINLCTLDFVIKLKVNIFSSSMKKVLVNMGPSIASVGVYELNSLVANQFSSMLGTGIVSYLFYADQILQLPFSVFGIALGSALLPTFAANIQRHKLHKVNFNFNKTLVFSLGFAIPAAVAIFFVSGVIVSFIYGHGKFGVSDVETVASILRVTVVSLPLQVMIKIMASLFFAGDDNSTPFRGAVVNFSVNFIVISACINSYGYISIAYGSVIASLCNTIYLFSKLPKYVYVIKRAKKIIFKELIGSAVVGVYCYLVGGLFAKFYYFNMYVKIFAIALIVLSGVFIYAYVGSKIGFVNISRLLKELRK